MSSNGNTILASAFFDVKTGANDSSLIAYPGVLQGTFTAISSNDFQTLEVLMRRALFRSCYGRVDFLAGYRYARLNDHRQ